MQQPLNIDEVRKSQALTYSPAGAKASGIPQIGSGLAVTPKPAVQGTSLPLTGSGALYAQNAFNVKGPAMQPPPAMQQPKSNPQLPQQKSQLPPPQPLMTPSGNQVTFTQQGTPEVKAQSYTIPTGNVPSDLFSESTTMRDVENKRSQYQDALVALQQAQQYSPEYINALKEANAIKARDAELSSNLITGNNLPGSTLGYAQQYTTREQALNDITGLRASQDLAVQQAIRSGNIEAAKAALEASKPQSISAGSSYIDPISGQVISTAPTQSFAEYQDALRSGFRGTLMDYNAAIQAQKDASGMQSIGAKFAGVSADDPNYINSLISMSVGGKAPNQVETIRPIQKAVAVIGQLGDLQQALSKTNTDPIVGTLRSMNPYDFDARAIQAILQSTVPNLARGVYGEVGVLTDQDIRNYIQTLPNIKGTKAQNDFVLAMTLKTVQRSLESNLETLAAAGYDISGFKSQYDRVSGEVNKLEKKAGISQQDTSNVGNDWASLYDN